jgi:hypothetical protein
MRFDCHRLLFHGCIYLSPGSSRSGNNLDLDYQLDSMSAYSVFPRDTARSHYVQDDVVMVAYPRYRSRSGTGLRPCHNCITTVNVAER